MSSRWIRVNLVFRLKSPLHIGYLPSKGSVVAPTRHYVPGRNFWGALTKKVTGLLYEEPEALDYREIGNEIRNRFRFSYFYIYDGETLYQPGYACGYLRYGSGGKFVDRYEFENRFLESQASTAIDDRSLTARSGSYHEIEYIKDKFLDASGRVRDTMLAGCFWVSEEEKPGARLKGLKVDDRGIWIDEFNIIEEFSLGGEVKYGFGRVALYKAGGIDWDFPPFTWENPDKIEIDENSPLVGHLPYSREFSFRGEIELVSGREYPDPQEKDAKPYQKPGQKIIAPSCHFAPGTVIDSNLKDREFCLDWDGKIKVKGGFLEG